MRYVEFFILQKHEAFIHPRHAIKCMNRASVLMCAAFVNNSPDTSRSFEACNKRITHGLEIRMNACKFAIGARETCDAYHACFLCLLFDAFQQAENMWNHGVRVYILHMLHEVACVFLEH
jgi:hypothetical protein